MKMSLVQSIMKNEFRPFSDSGIVIKPDQIINGKILKIMSDNLALLQIGSVKMVAELEVPLKANETYLFQNISKTNQLILKMIEPLKDQQMNVKTLTNQILDFFSISKNSYSKKIVHYFLDHDLPLTNEILSKTFEWLKDSVNIQSDLKVVNQLLKGNLPFTHQVFKGLSSFIDDTPISTFLKNIMVFLPESNLKDRLVEIIKASEGGPYNDIQPPEEIVKILKQMIQRLGLQHEYDILNIDNDQNKNFMETLKPLLMEIEKTSTNPIVKEQADSAIHKLTGMQLMSGSDGPMMQYVMQIPLYFGGALKDLTIQWSGKKNKSDRIDPDYCRIIFYLDLDALKETVIDMQIQNRIINVTIFNDHDDLATMIGTMQQTLKGKLSQMQYTLSSIKIQKSHQHVTLNKNSLFQTPGQYSGVDIRI